MKLSEKFQRWFTEFMQGRYGYDELSKSMFTLAIVLIIVSVVLQMLSGLLGNWIYWVGNVVNLAAFIVLIYSFVRVFSKNHSKRRAENESWLAARGRANKKRTQAIERKDYKYLKCKNCKQEMRVPRGKGKIAVKCPKCGEKTIVKS